MYQRRQHFALPQCPYEMGFEHRTAARRAECETQNQANKSYVQCFGFILPELDQVLMHLSTENKQT